MVVVLVAVIPEQRARRFRKKKKKTAVAACAAVMFYYTLHLSSLAVLGKVCRWYALQRVGGGIFLAGVRLDSPAKGVTPSCCCVVVECLLRAWRLGWGLCLARHVYAYVRGFADPVFGFQR